MTLDYAIELLEITDIDALTDNELQIKRKRAMARWHPDSIPLASEELKKKYEGNFKNIELAVRLILGYKSGDYFAGQDIEEDRVDVKYKQQEATYRKEVGDWRTKILNVWQQIKQKNWMIDNRETVLSDGYLLRDKLREDIKDEAPALSIMSIFYGFYVFFALSIIGMFFRPLFFILTPVYLGHVVLCSLLFLPLSRHWLPEWLSDIAVKSCNMGLQAGNFIYNTFGELRFFRVLIRWPLYFSKGMLLLFVTPLYELGGYILKDKIVGVKKKKERYFGDYPETYVELLLQKEPSTLSWQELKYMYDINNLCSKFN